MARFEDDRPGHAAVVHRHRADVTKCLRTALNQPTRHIYRTDVDLLSAKYGSDPDVLGCASFLREPVFRPATKTRTAPNDV